MIIKQFCLFYDITSLTDCCTDWEFIIHPIYKWRNKFCLHHVTYRFSHRVFYIGNFRILRITVIFMKIRNHTLLHCKHLWNIISIIIRSRNKCIRCSQIYCISITIIGTLCSSPLRQQEAAICSNS